MRIIEQIKELRGYAYAHEASGDCIQGTANELYEAADTIEALAAKLEKTNEELERWHTDHINEKIKNPFAYTSTLICHNCDHKDEYIEELEAEVEELKANMERPEGDCDGGWILHGDDWVKIHIEATGQDTVARLKLKWVGVSDLLVAVLYDIPNGLKPFPCFFSKVRLCGKELEFYYGDNGNLIQRYSMPFEFWFGKAVKENAK